MKLSVPAKSAEIHAVKILADGRRVDLGCIAYWHRNPLMRLWRKIKEHLHGNRIH